jgi:hypothetical protein
MKQIDSISPLLLACRMAIAKEQSFQHASRLALWRCTTAGDYVELQMMRYAPLSSQARWCATTQRDFTAWLAAGGFAQQEAQEAQQIKQRDEHLASHRGEEMCMSKLHETA